MGYTELVCPRCFKKCINGNDGSLKDIEEYPYDYGYIEDGYFLVNHVCDNSDIARVQELRNDLVTDFGEVTVPLLPSHVEGIVNSVQALNAGREMELKSAKNKVMAQLHKQAYDQSCPKCKAGIGERCRNLTKASSKLYNEYPHKERRVFINYGNSLDNLSKESNSLKAFQEKVRRAEILNNEIEYKLLELVGILRDLDNHRK